MATIVDGVRQRPTYETTGFVTDTEMYLYNIGAGQFFTEGNAWGTQASVGETGLLVKITGSEDNYFLYDFSIVKGNRWMQTFFDTETALYVDLNNQANYYFDIEDNGNTFRISTSSKNPTFGDYAGAGLYVGLKKNSSSTALSPFVDKDEAYVDWAFVTVENYEALSASLDIYNKAQELKMWIDKIEEQNGDASSLSSVYLNENATMVELEAAIASAQPIYIQALVNNASDKENVDVTSALVNPDFEYGLARATDPKGYGGDYGTAEGWVVDRNDAGNVTPGPLGTDNDAKMIEAIGRTNHCFEAWHCHDFDVYQEMTGLPVGVYEVEVQGYMRCEASDYTRGDLEGLPNMPIYLYLNKATSQFPDVYSEKRNNWEYVIVEDWTKEEINGYEYPNSMGAAAQCFAHGMYKKNAYGLIASDQEVLRIGVKGKTDKDAWVIWDNFKLTYRGFKPDVVKPVLEEAVNEIKAYEGLVMGKTEYAALKKALSDAATAIENNDGEAMFNALTDLYAVKDDARISKDLFDERGVNDDVTSLSDAIAATEGKKLYVETLQVAQALLEAITNNTKYEGTEIDQLKIDVSDAINNLNNSVSLYADLNTAIQSLTTAANAKATQSLIDEALELLPIVQAAYDEGSIANADVNAQITALNSKAAEINASATKYTSLSEAITRLTEAIAIASEESSRVAKSTLTKANLRLTATQTLYDNGSIATDAIDERIEVIDVLVTELTHSIELYRQFNTGLIALQEALATEEKLSSETRNAAQAIYNTALEAYNEGTIDDDQMETQVAALSAQVTAIENSVSLYAQLAETYPALEDVISLKAHQTLVDEANELYTTASEGVAQGTIADDDVSDMIAAIEAIIPQVQASAEKYAELAAAITRLEEAIALASTDEARVAKSTLRKANLRQTATQTLYNNGTIADEEIDDRVETIDQLIEELTHSILLYQQFAGGLASLAEALTTEEKLSSETRNAAQAIYDTALEAYNEGTIDDDQMEAQVAALSAQVTAIENSVSLYAQLAETYPALEDVISLKAHQTLVDEANELYTTASEGVAQGTIADDDVSDMIAAIEAIIPQVQASAEKYAELAAAITRLEEAIALASTDEARVAKSTLRKANLRQTATQTLYNNGTIADEEIDDRVETIDQLIEELTHSILLYQQFASALESLNETLSNIGKVSEATLMTAQDIYESALAAYNEGAIDDDKVEAQIAELNEQVINLANSAAAYAQMAEAINSLTTAVETAEGKVSSTMFSNAQAQLTSAQTSYNEGSVPDADVASEVTKLKNVTINLNKAKGLDAKAIALATNLSELNALLSQARSQMAQAQIDVQSAYIESALKSQIVARLNEIESQLITLTASYDDLNHRLTNDQKTLKDATDAMTADYSAALTDAASDLANMETELSSALNEMEDIMSYLAVQPAQAIAESSNIVELKAEYGTFCSSLNLDFTNVEGLKAYIVSAYIPAEGKVVLTRVMNVPAGTGIIVAGTPNGRYEIPEGDGSAVLSTLLVGVTRSKELPVTEGTNTNCILANGTYGVGFYPTTGGIIAAGKAYLPLPTSVFEQQSDVKGFTIVFDDATGVKSITDGGTEGIWYTMDGQMLQHKPSVPGVYVRDGKKVLIK